MNDGFQQFLLALHVDDRFARLGQLLLDSTLETLYMTLVSTLFAYLLGIPLGIALTVTEDGTAANASVVQSSGSIILDQYAIDSVNLWQFHPAKRGDRSVSTSVTIPLRFISTMISVPAAPTSQVLKDMPEEVREAAERNAHPVLTVKVYVNSDGKMDGAPEVMKDEKLSGADFKALSKYVTASVKTWTFTAAKNPDGEAIGSEVLIPVQV